jgi:hypothetical protein
MRYDIIGPAMQLVWFYFFFIGAATSKERHSQKAAV